MIQFTTNDPLESLLLHSFFKEYSKQELQEGEAKTCAQNLMLVLLIGHHFPQAQVHLLYLGLNPMAFMLHV